MKTSSTPNNRPTTHYMRRIWQLARPYWWLVSLAIVFSFVASSLQGAIAWLVKPAMDKVLLARNYQYLALLPVGVIALIFLRSGAAFVQSYCMRVASLRLVRDVRNLLYHHLIRLPVGYFQKETSGRIVSRLVTDVSLIETSLGTIFQTTMIEGATVITLAAVALWRRWDLALLSFIVLPLVGYMARRLGVRIHRRRHRAQEKIADVTHRISEAIQGLKVIKVFGQESQRERIFSQENKRFYREMVRLTRLKEGTRILADGLTGLGVALVLWYGGSLVVRGVITSGDFFSILTALFMVFTPVKRLARSYTNIQEIRAAIDRVDQLLYLPEEKSGQHPIDSFRREIRFEKVSFAYPGSSEPVLKEVDLVIGQGEVVAIVGPSGAGKSTLVDLIPRFFDPTSGRILIDGLDLRELDLRDLRNLMAIVSQDVILFNDTVAENIAFGRPEASLEEIIEAAKMAYAHEFIENLPQGYQTLLGERGLNLSGGQRQRIAIARAILKNPPILILDEATSALDAVSERLVQKALEKMMIGRTTIVVAHRLSTIKGADKIVVLDQGQIIAQGRHEELFQKNPTYRQLYSTFLNEEERSQVIPLKR